MDFKLVKAVAFPVLSFIMAIVCGFIVFPLYERTLIDWWIPVLVALTLAALTLCFSSKWQWLARTDWGIANYVYYLACVGTYCYVLFMGLNFVFSDKASTRTEKVMVERKYIETRRVRSRRGAGYTTRSHCLLLVFENGQEKTISVPQSVYDKTKAGSSRVMTLRKGLFGFPIINFETKMATTGDCYSYFHFSTGGEARTFCKSE